MDVRRERPRELQQRQPRRQAVAVVGSIIFFTSVIFVAGNADLSVLSDDSLILGEVDAKGLVISYVALDPLDIRTELVQHLIRFGGSTPELLSLKSADFGDVSLNDEPAEYHNVLLRMPLLGETYYSVSLDAIRARQVLIALIQSLLWVISCRSDANWGRPLLPHKRTCDRHRLLPDPWNNFPATRFEIPCSAAQGICLQAIEISR
ncbi:MAG: hypothetical protein WBE48_09490 [Xanthobacteraceae bacterium]